MEPVPAGNAAELAAFPIEDGPDALRGNLDVPGSKIAVLNGGVEEVLAKFGRVEREELFSRSGFFQPAPGRGFGERDFFASIHPGTKKGGEGSFVAGPG